MSIPCITTTQTLTIVRGEEKEFYIRLKTESDDFYNLSSIDPASGDNISVIFLKADNTTLTKGLINGVSIVSAEGGKIKVILQETETALLKVGDSQDIEVEILENGGTSKRIIQIKGVLNVVKRLGE
jgi:hypothetical protein